MLVRKLFKRKTQSNNEIALNAPWTKYYGDVPKNINYFQGTIAEMIEMSAN